MERLIWDGLIFNVKVLYSIYWIVDTAIPPYRHTAIPNFLVVDLPLCRRMAEWLNDIRILYTGISKLRQNMIR